MQVLYHHVPVEGCKNRYFKVRVRSFAVRVTVKQSPHILSLRAAYEKRCFSEEELSFPPPELR
eukprot:4356834-Prorocentrum_lima.AAC.1